MVIDKTSSSSNRKMKKNNKNNSSSNNSNSNNNANLIESSTVPIISQPVMIAPQAQPLDASSTSKSKKKQQQQQQQLQAKSNEILKQSSRDEDEENESSNNNSHSNSSSGSSGSIDAVCVNSDVKRNVNNRRNSSDVTVSSQKMMVNLDNGGGVATNLEQRNKFQEINLNLLSDLSDDSNSSSSSSQSSPPPPLTSIQLQQQQQHQQYHASTTANTTQHNPTNFYQTTMVTPQQLVQQVHPIQTVQPFKNFSTPLATISTNMQASKHQSSNSLMKKDQTQSNNNNNNNKMLPAVVASMDLMEPRKQMLIEQQLKQELEIDLELDSSPMSSLMMNKQYMMQPQRLDNNAIQTLVCDQTKAYLILDDKEALQVNNKKLFD